MKKKLGQMLIEKGLITEERLLMGLSRQKVTGNLIGETLVKLGFATSSEIAQTLAEQAGIPFIDLSEYAISEDAMKLVPKDVAEKTGFIPIKVSEDFVEIGITNPTNIQAIDTAFKLIKKQPKVFMIDNEVFNEKLDRAYFFLEKPIQKLINKAIEDIRSAETPPINIIADLSQNLIMEGIKRKATDIHITPTQDTIDVFYRVFGVLQYGFCIPKIVFSGIVSIIKVRSKMDISEQRMPQDGSFSSKFFDKEFELRVSTSPTIYGENLVLRILAGSGSLINMGSLGFDAGNTKRLRALFQKPYGVILITGPTGSGKTTTLYAALREIDLIERNVLTVEDPVEYRLSFVKQTSVNVKTGYDFAVAGRNFMRQDPDVILLGEIRDEETAKIAIRASMTGHLVLSTLHTNDAVTAIPRMMDFNIDRFMLSSSLLAVISQRLVRRLCSHCKEPYPISEEKLRAWDIFVDDDDYKITTAYRAKGCDVCYQIGYVGREAMGEIAVINDEMKELVSEGASLIKIRDAALRSGMVPLKLNAIKKAKEGVTTVEEIMRLVT